MGKNKQTSILVDGLLRFAALGGILTVGIVAPNAIQTLDKPLKMYFSKLDKRAREREYYRLTNYMRKQNLLSPKDRTKSYEHGMILSEHGKSRAKSANLDYLTIPPQIKWDNKWRIVLFDIPENKKRNRDYLTLKLKELGFIQLQRSVWVYPFPCRDEVLAIVEQYEVRRFVTYIETSHIDYDVDLKTRYNFKF